MEKKNKRLLLVFLIGFIIGVIGFSTSLFIYLKIDDEKIVDNNIEIADNNDDIVTSGIVFNSIDNTVHLDNAIPTLDKFGIKEKGFSFSIKNNTNKEMQYQLSLVDDNSTIKNSNIRYELTKNNKVLGIYSLEEDGILEKAIINSQEEINYIIKIWLDYNSDVKVGRFSKKIAVKEIFDEDIKTTTIEPNEPVIITGMIPVYYDYETNSWYKSDNKNTYNSIWYDYEEGKWANAVTVDSEKREYYQKAAIGTKINPTDINSMWVWIPRFNYEISDDNINVNFVKVSDKAYQAFTFNEKELSGFWFAKFESGLKEDSECITSSLTQKCNDSDNTFYFVPNYSFSTKITMANLFYAFRKMELKDNIYGFDGTGTMVNSDGTIKNDKNDFDIHMIRNSEWQAVVLLSSSKYNKEIINNNSGYTGKSYYQNELYDYNVLGKGDTGSITGNITGVYDMAGGKREYVMINNSELNIFNKKSNSGFNTSVKNYYYDNDFNDDDTTMKLREKNSKENLLNSEPVTRGGYKNTGNIFSIYGANDYINKISVETNSRASIVILKENNNEEKES